VNTSNNIDGAFPILLSTGYHITSPSTTDYNCVAWAAEDNAAWWWPDAYGFGYWPPQAIREETIDAFIDAYRLLGYQPCAGSEAEPGYDKVAIYVDGGGVPTHVARLLQSGYWTSKLGELQDIEHNTLEGLEGHLYGSVGQVLRRRMDSVETAPQPTRS
jgi:hypothetical protein